MKQVAAHIAASLCLLAFSAPSVAAEQRGGWDRFIHAAQPAPQPDWAMRWADLPELWKLQQGVGNLSTAPNLHLRTLGTICQADDPKSAGTAA